MGLLKEESDKSKYLEFEFHNKSKSGKTSIYLINKKDGFNIGSISWHGQWRQYIFIPQDMTIWSSGCLDDISKFLKLLNEKQKVGCGNNSDLKLRR